MQKIIIRKTEDIEKIAKFFLSQIFKLKNKKAKIVGLYGELGAGKTAFVKTVGKILGIKTKISSPTFVIIKKYKLKTTRHRQLFHIDAYRLKNEKDLEDLGWKEIISDPRNVVFIEWPEKVKKIVPRKHHKVSIFYLKKEGRLFRIKI